MVSEAATSRPNVLLVMTDQQRGDCLGVEGAHPVLTPNMDALGAQGTRFSRAYSSCPVCIPARRSLLSGQFPSTHGLVGNRDGLDWNEERTLPALLREAGYQTFMVGRNMHQHPRRRRFGYDEMVINFDYQRWLDRQLPTDSAHEVWTYGGPSYATGVMHNDWTARPWPYAEDLHFTNWTVAEARRFLARRDPSCPFFLTVSFLAPHPPLTPPAFYMDRYLRMRLPEPVIGEWAEPPRGVTAPDSAKVCWQEEARRSALSGYYGLINHVDDQLRRLIYPLHGIEGFDLDNTLIVFTSDHGEMLGDHYRWRKSLPYEGAARIPLLVRPPARFGFEAGQVLDAPAGLEDVLPTILDLAAVDLPAGLDGASLVPLMRGESVQWRDHLHLEHAPTFHALTDGRHKYVWFVADGAEQLFDLVADPTERHDLAHAPDHAPALETWRKAMIAELAGRPEGFVRDGQLLPGRDYRTMIPAGR